MCREEDSRRSCSWHWRSSAPRRRSAPANSARRSRRTASRTPASTEAPTCATTTAAPGFAIEFHTAGVAYSPAPDLGRPVAVRRRVRPVPGRLVHVQPRHPSRPSTRRRSPVSQLFPNDPTGAKGAYLTWRYGDTTDNLTAAAMWAVFHYYAQDGAGTRRALDAAAPLIPSLGMIAGASGERRTADRRDRARRRGQRGSRGSGRSQSRWRTDGQIDVAVVAGAQPVAGAAVTLLISGQDAPTTVFTDAAGSAHSTMPPAPGAMTVVASTSAPGAAAGLPRQPGGPGSAGRADVWSPADRHAIDQRHRGRRRAGPADDHDHHDRRRPRRPTTTTTTDDDHRPRRRPRPIAADDHHDDHRADDDDVDHDDAAAGDDDDARSPRSRRRHSRPDTTLAADRRRSLPPVPRPPRPARHCRGPAGLRARLLPRHVAAGRRDRDCRRRESAAEPPARGVDSADGGHR